MRADAILDAVGLSVDDAHPVVIDPQRVGADLRHRGDESLPNIGAAGHQFDAAARIDADPRAIERAEPTLVDKDPDPGADQLAGRAALLQLAL